MPSLSFFKSGGKAGDKGRPSLDERPDLPRIDVPATPTPAQGVKLTRSTSAGGSESPGWSTRLLRRKLSTKSNMGEHHRGASSVAVHRPRRGTDESSIRGGTVTSDGSPERVNALRFPAQQAVPSSPPREGAAQLTNKGSVRSVRSNRSDARPPNPFAIDHAFVIDGGAELPAGPHHPFLVRPVTPPAVSGATPLSPPRRPLASRSPHPPPPPLRHPGASTTNLASTLTNGPTNPNGMATSSPSGSPPPPSSAMTVPTASPPAPRDSRPSSPTSGSPSSGEGSAPPLAQWLVRKPSGRRRPGISTTDRRIRRAESTSSSAQASSASGDSAANDEVPVTPFTPIPGVHIPNHINAPPLSALGNQSFPFSGRTHTPTGSIGQPIRPRTPSREGYCVEVQCVPGDDEVRWEVVLRRVPGGGAGAPPPLSPLDLGTTGTITAHAPPLASSVNLSLALDAEAPSGKLVFIALPSDAQSTPTRVRSRNSGVNSPRQSSQFSPRILASPANPAFSGNGNGNGNGNLGVSSYSLSPTGGTTPTPSTPGLAPAATIPSVGMRHGTPPPGIRHATPPPGLPSPTELTFSSLSPRTTSKRHAQVWIPRGSDDLFSPGRESPDDSELGSLEQMDTDLDTLSIADRVGQCA